MVTSCKLVSLYRPIVLSVFRQLKLSLSSGVISTFERPPKFGRITVYLDLVVVAEDLSDDSLNILLSQESMVKCWPFILLLTDSRAVEVIEDPI